MKKNRSVVRSLGLMGVTLLLVLLATTVVFAGRGDGNFTATPLQGEVVSVDAAKPQVTADRSASRVDPTSLRPVSIIVTLDAAVSDAELEAVSGGEVVHRYTKVFDGASLVLPEGNIEAVSKMTGVSGVYLDEVRQLDTEVSPQFIGAPTAWWQAGGVNVAGEGVIVGILDSGIWPEHPSVSDPDPAGNAFPAPPVVPGSNGFSGGVARSTCDFGNTAYNPDDAPFACNNKLIGAYAFIDTYKAVQGLLPTEFDSARDDDGHGSHTMTTSAGNSGVEATLLGVPRGIVSGIAPRAHVIAYRVCGAEGCYNSDSVAAVEQAILDGVDVINFSISGGGNPYSDAVELAFASAYDNGVFVSASAGNSGPVPDTVAHRGPWTMTVAASTADRTYTSTVYLSADGETQELHGISITEGIDTETPVIFAPERLCLEPFPAGTFNGEIVLCQRGVNNRVDKSYNVAEGGAAGMILYNPVLGGLALDSHYIPSVHIEVDQTELLLAFMDAHDDVVGWFTPGTATPTQGDVMAAFSSRGGKNQSLGVNKPDITAPGVQILAGYTPMPAVPSGVDGQLFGILNGTSMSSPHVAGSAAMMVDLHPEWTPGQIKSALMLTAITAVVKEDGVTPADAYDMGSGRVDLNRAGDARLTMDESIDNYFLYADELWMANYPSLYHPNMTGSFTVNRTFKNEVNAQRVFRFTTDAPDDVQITVTPDRISLDPMGEATVSITVSAPTVPLGEVRFGMIYVTQSDGSNQMVFPVSFVRGQADVALTKSCDPAVFLLGTRSSCEVTVQNTTFEPAYVEVRDRLHWKTSLVTSSVVGGTKFENGVMWSGWLSGAQPPLVSAEVNPLASPAGYLPLSLFGIAPVAGVSDESIANFNVPTFEYAGELYSRIGIVSNGYAVVGGGTGADVDYINTNLPDVNPPNNVLAPFWTDLNPSVGGALRVGILGDGSDSWLILDWEGVPNWGDGELNDFQIWIGVDGDANSGEDISFVYGPRISDGDSGFLTVGAENKFGNSGQAVYFDGAGTPPSPSFPNGDFEVDVFSSPGAAGGSHTISYEMRAAADLGLTPFIGDFTNCAEMTSPWFSGISYACLDGRIVRSAP